MKSSYQTAHHTPFLQSIAMAFFFLLLATLASASPTNPYGAPNEYGPQPQIATSTESVSVMPQMSTITTEILNSPYLSLQSFTQRDVHTPPTTAASSSFMSATGLDLSTTQSTVASDPTSHSFALDPTTFTLAMDHDVIITLSSSVSKHAPTNATASMPRWDCSGICGELTNDMDCSRTVGCVDTHAGANETRKHVSSSGVDSVRLDAYVGGRRYAVGLMVGILVWLLVWLVL